MFKGSIAKILITVIFLRIRLIMDFYNLYIPQIFLASFPPSPGFLQHTCEPFMLHQCTTAHWLKIAVVEDSISSTSCDL